MWDKFFLLMLVTGVVDFIIKPMSWHCGMPRVSLTEDLKRATAHLLAMELTIFLFFGVGQVLWLPVGLAALYFCLDRLSRTLAHKGHATASLVIAQFAKAAIVAVLTNIVPLTPNGVVPVFAARLLSDEALVTSPFAKHFLSTATIYVYVAFGGTAFVRCVLDGFRLDSVNSEGLYRAGELIGVFERLLILTFMLLLSFSAIAFVLTAKSIARFDRITKDQKFAEYYLVGTLASASLAVLGGVLLNYLHSLS